MSEDPDTKLAERVQGLMLESDCLEKLEKTREMLDAIAEKTNTEWYVHNVHYEYEGDESVTVVEMDLKFEAPLDSIVLSVDINKE